MGTKNESPEPNCQEQFQAAVRVIQNLPKNSKGEGMGTCIWGVKMTGVYILGGPDPVSFCRQVPAWAVLGVPFASCPWVDPSPSLPSPRGGSPPTSILLALGVMLCPPLPNFLCRLLPPLL